MDKHNETGGEVVETVVPCAEDNETDEIFVPKLLRLVYTQALDGVIETEVQDVRLP